MIGPRLFDDNEVFGESDINRLTSHAKIAAHETYDKVRKSALWSAYGDALGWISELTNESGLMRRTKGVQLTTPIEWKRRIGGRAGVTVSLPAGCYSDDSQLRLATSRSIRADGFDVEAFSKVELPVWLSYALGGGKSTSAAAVNLGRPRVQWFANNYRGWTKSGGNGAAMRIQPHVWSARAPNDPSTFLPDVIRNAICTHSHPIGLMGAVLHALILARAMSTGRHPTPEDLIGAVGIAANFLDAIHDDVELGQYWRSAYEDVSGAFSAGWTQALVDCEKAILIAASSCNRTGADRYETIVDRLRLREPARRGNGMLTAVAAVGLIWCESRPDLALRLAANSIGTDTDTIATMAGAILGVNAETEPPIEILDADLFRSEADRLSKIAIGKRPGHHQYPDLLHWSAPKTRADALVRSVNGDVFVRGLGRAEPQGDPVRSAKADFLWQWVKLDVGQTLLIKRRRELATMNEGVSGRSVHKSSGIHSVPPGDSNQPDLSAAYEGEIEMPYATLARELREGHSSPEKSQPDLDAMLSYLERYKYDDRIVGQVIRRVVNKCTVGQIGAFLAAVVDCLKEPQIPPAGRRR